jgi:hypothetical protein
MKYLVFFLLFFTFSLNAQTHLKGIVKDASSKKTIPFATITIQNGGKYIADADGKFDIKTPKNISAITVSYLDYDSKIVTLNLNYFQTVLLPKSRYIPKESVAKNKENANSIIAKVIANKLKNNPLDKLKSFQCTTYNKLLVSANPDSIAGNIDSVFVNSMSGKVFHKLDSSEYKFKKIIDRQHLFLAEKIATVQFSKPNFKETVIGSKMAGFKEPIYEYFGFKLQSYSIYDDKYELFETKYKSPIATNSITEYSYKIIDTIAVDNRKTIVIQFKNKKRKKGLEGILHIDTQNFAVAKAIFKAKGVVNITSVHDFTYYPENEIWFQSKRKFEIVKGKSREATSILGGRIKFQADDDTENKNKKSDDFTYLISETETYNLSFNEQINIKKSHISVDVAQNASSRTEGFWQQSRNSILDDRSIKTYETLDSIATKNRIENKIWLGRKVFNGYVPIHFFDVDLRHLISYNNFEGFRFGIGGITNEKLSKIIRFEGYSAYGLKDENIKYSLGLATRIGNLSSTWIGGSYTDDIREIASTNFAIDKRVFKLYDPRPINISTVYNHKTWRGFIETKIIPKSESIWQLTHSKITPLFGYQFELHDKIYDAFTISSAMFSLQWNPFSDYMQTPNGKLEIEKRFPKFTFQFTKSLPNIIENDFDFGKIDFRIDYEKKYLNGQKSTILSQFGYAFGEIPITHLYNTSPNNLTKDIILQRVTIAGKNSFETMYFNEFFSSKFAMFQLKHGFKRIELFKKVKPQLVIVSRMAWGNLDHKERHLGIDFKTLERGFFESGIELNKIFHGFGLTTFYRYGPNQLSKFEDNIAIKLSFVLDLGLD